MMSNSTSSQHTPCSSVTIDSGSISGLQLPNNTRAFLGIPYAAPPLENLRWRPPQPPKPWTGVFRAEKFGAASLQARPPASIYSGGEVGFSEDCLYLNVWTVGEHDDSQRKVKRPVLVWFHFGAFQVGSGANPVYDGRNMAELGVVVVAINYRLGRFGFLTLPELSAESGVGASGNYGIMDQIAALEWVNRNIDAFGGDPRNVTIAGASAGGESVHILRCSPLARGLFTKAICVSGPSVLPVLDGPGHLGARTTLRAAEEVGEQLLDLLGVSSVADLRQVPAHDIMTAHLPWMNGPWKSGSWAGSNSLSVFDTKNPIIDGYVLPDSPLTMMQRGKAADIPMLVGNAANEESGMLYLESLADFHAYVNEAFHENARKVLSLYPANNDSEAKVASSQFLADQVFVWPTWTSARLQARNLKSPVWYYTFRRASPIPCDSDVIERDSAGAFHCADVFYAFNNLDVWPWAWTDADKALSRDVLETWVRFLQTGAPNISHTHAEFWPPLKPTSSSIKIWDLKSRIEPPDSRFCQMTAVLDKHYELDTGLLTCKTYELASRVKLARRMNAF